MLYPLNPHGFLARILRFLLLSQGNQSWSLWSKKNVIGSISNIKATVVTCIMRPHDDRYSRKKRLTRNAWPSTFGLQFDPFHIVSFSPLHAEKVVLTFVRSGKWQWLIWTVRLRLGLIKFVCLSQLVRELNQAVATHVALATHLGGSGDGPHLRDELRRARRTAQEAAAAAKATLLPALLE